MPRLPKFRVKSKTVRIGKLIRARVVRQVELRESRTKYFVLQEIHSPDWNGAPRTMFRIGYYIIGKKRRMRNKWAWGQYAPLFWPGDLERLIAKAKRNGILK